MQLSGPRGLWAGGGRRGSLHPAEAASSAAWALGPRQNRRREQPWPPRLLEQDVPRDASPSLVPVPWALGFGFLAIVLCSFIPACAHALVHSCSLIHSLLRAARGREGRPRAPRAGLAPLLQAGRLGANCSSQRAWCCSGGCREGGGFWRERVQWPVRVCRACPSPARARRRAPSALLERVPPFPAFRRPMGASGHSWPRPPRAAVLTGISRPSPTAVPPECVHLTHMRAPRARLHAPTCTQTQEQHVSGSRTHFLGHCGDTGHTCVRTARRTPPLPPRRTRPCLPAPGTHVPWARFCTVHPCVCTSACAQLCQHPPTGLCLFFNSHAGRLYSGPVSVLSKWGVHSAPLPALRAGACQEPRPQVRKQAWEVGKSGRAPGHGRPRRGASPAPPRAPNPPGRCSLTVCGVHCLPA